MEPTHEFLIDPDHPERRLRRLVELRDQIDGLRETTATFKPVKSLSGDAYGEAAPDNLLAMLGAWPVPDHYKQGDAKVYVNPRYVHAHTYSDLKFECECGLTYGEVENGNGGRAGAPHHHDDSCSELSRRAAKEKLRTARIAWVRRCAHLRVPMQDAVGRTGVSRHQVTREYKWMPEGWSDWYSEGKRRAANTIVLLNREYDVSAQLIADAYDCSTSLVYTYKDHCDREYVEQRAPGVLSDQRRSSTASASGD